MRLRAQELAGKTKTMHGDVSENCSGHHGTEKQCSIYEEIEQHIPGIVSSLTYALSSPCYASMSFLKVLVVRAMRILLLLADCWQLRSWMSEESCRLWPGHEHEKYGPPGFSPIFN